MYTVDDYIKYYNNVTFEESPFNDMDNIVFSCLAYLPFNKVLSGSDTLFNVFNNIHKYEKEYMNIKTILGKKAYEIIKVLAKGKRYKDVVLSNYIYLVNEKTQFISIKFSYKDFCYVAYCGTDNSIIGWKENFVLSYMYPSITQVNAISYLSSVIKDEKIIYVGGHSKGGNLAMVSAMEASDDIFNRIKFVYNNDGPGFLDKEFNSSKYKRLYPKLKNFLPEESMIGILLNNKNYTVVKSSAKGPYQHDFTTWYCFGPFLVTGVLSNGSKKLKKRLNEWTLSISDSDKKILVDTFFDVIKESGIKHFWEVKDLKWPEISSMVREAKNIDESSKKLLLNSLKELIEIDFKRDK